MVIQQLLSRLPIGKRTKKSRNLLSSTAWNYSGGWHHQFPLHTLRCKRHCHTAVDRSAPSHFPLSVSNHGSWKKKKTTDNKAFLVSQNESSVKWNVTRTSCLPICLLCHSFTHSEIGQVNCNLRHPPSFDEWHEFHHVHLSRSLWQVAPKDRGASSFQWLNVRLIYAHILP